MAVCSSCGSEVDDSSNFCTSCGQPMAKVQPAPTAGSGPVCPSCGKAVEGSSAFCTGCGKKLPAPASAAPTSITEPAAAPAPAAATPAAEQIVAPPAAAPVVAAAAPQIDHAAEAAPKQSAAEPASRATQPSYAAQGAYSNNQQPSGGKFGLVVFILLTIIVGGALGGWYFWGVETVVVCSPPDVTVFLDDQQVAPTSYGRYVIPHLSRKPHLLKVQKPGFADTIEKLDFPLTSSREWVNIRLVPSRQIRP
jgi:Double zinc ribbon